MDASARLALPFLVPGQAQKEFFHNEALQLLDIIVQPAVEGAARNDPPLQPSIGSSYLVGEAPTGAFQGHADAIACWTQGGWRFCEAFDGLEVGIKGSGERARYSGGEWSVGVIEATAVRVNGQQVLADRQPAIADAIGGTVIDENARSVLSEILVALRRHGLISAT